MENSTSSGPKADRGLTLEQYADAKLLRFDDLVDYGLTELHHPSANGPAVSIPYRNARGETVATQFLLSLEGGGKYKLKNGNSPILYGLDRLDRSAESVIIATDPIDIHTLWQHGYNAIGLPSGGWRDEDASLFSQIDTVYVLLEPDQEGERTRESFMRSSLREKVRLVSLDPWSDASHLHVDLDGDDSVRSIIDHQVDRAPMATEVAKERRDVEAQEAWSKAEQLAKDPNILERFLEDLARLGVVGEQENAQILFLCLTSRLLDTPVSAVIKGQSSSGKSFVANKTLRFFNDGDDFIQVSSLSDKALFYTDRDLRHKFIVLAEADGVRGKGDYALRTLLSEGRLIHEAVVTDERTGQRKTQKTLTEGPTGLLMTTTRVQLHHENETRLISLQSDDSPEQTRRIVLASAGGDVEDFDLGPWHALQTCLSAGATRVHIPYFHEIAAASSDRAVRMRRAIGQLWSLISAHALLHGASRKIDEDGRIVAQWQDYFAVHPLISHVMSDSQAVAVLPSIRETVVAVERLIESRGSVGHSTIREVSDVLGLDQSTVRRRVRAAEAEGYLVAEGKPMQIRLGDPMPEDQQVFPDPANYPWSADSRMVGVRDPDLHGTGWKIGEGPECPTCGRLLTSLSDGSNECLDCMHIA